MHSAWDYDNKFLSSSPYVTKGGILFGAGPFPPYLYNLSSPDGGLSYVLSTHNLAIYLEMGDTGTLAVTQTPLPAAIWLFGTVLVGGMGLITRHRRRNSARLTNAALA